MAQACKYVVDLVKSDTDSDPRDVVLLDVTDADSDCEIVEPTPRAPAAFKGQGPVAVAPGLATPLAQPPLHAKAALRGLGGLLQGGVDAPADSTSLTGASSRELGGSSQAVKASQAVQFPATTATLVKLESGMMLPTVDHCNSTQLVSAAELSMASTQEQAIKAAKGAAGLGSNRSPLTPPNAPLMTSKQQQPLSCSRCRFSCKGCDRCRDKPGNELEAYFNPVRQQLQQQQRHEMEEPAAPEAAVARDAGTDAIDAAVTEAALPPLSAAVSTPPAAAGAPAPAAAAADLAMDTGVADGKTMLHPSGPTAIAAAAAATAAAAGRNLETRRKPQQAVMGFITRLVKQQQQQMQMQHQQQQHEAQKQTQDLQQCRDLQQQQEKQQQDLQQQSQDQQQCRDTQHCRDLQQHQQQQKKKQDLQQQTQDQQQCRDQQQQQQEPGLHQQRTQMPQQQQPPVVAQQTEYSQQSRGLQQQQQKETEQQQEEQGKEPHLLDPHDNGMPDTPAADASDVEPTTDAAAEDVLAEATDQQALSDELAAAAAAAVHDADAAATAAAAAAGPSDPDCNPLHSHPPRRSAAAKADQQLKLQAQAKGYFPRDPAAVAAAKAAEAAAKAAEAAAAQRVKAGRMEAEADKRELEMSRKVFGDEGFQPLRPHAAMRENGDILEPAKVFEGGRLLAQVRHEFDSGGEGSDNYQIYDDVIKGGRWCVADDDHAADGPFSKLLDLKCMIGQPLVYSCKPVLTGYRNRPVGDAELMSACCRAELAQAKDTGNDIKCLNPECLKRPTWQRCVYEKRHLNIGQKAQAHEYYNSTEHWVLERAGMSLKMFSIAISAGHLNTVRCIFCNQDDPLPYVLEAAARAADASEPAAALVIDPNCSVNPPTDALKPCSTCPMACHKTCYKAFTGDCQVPDDDTPEDDEFWQCISCREAAACAAAGCDWCKETSPHLKQDMEYMVQEYERLEQEAAAAAEGKEEQDEEVEEEETDADDEVETTKAAAAKRVHRSQLQQQYRQRKKARKSDSSAAADIGGRKRVKPEPQQRQQQRRKRCKRRRAEKQGAEPQDGSSSSRGDSDLDSDSDTDSDAARQVKFANLLKNKRLTAADLQVDNTTYSRFCPRLLAAKQIANPDNQAPGTTAAAGPATAGSSRAAGTEPGVPLTAGSGAQDAAAAAGVDGSAMLAPEDSKELGSSSQTAAATAVAGEAAGLDAGAAELEVAAAPAADAGFDVAADAGFDVAADAWPVPLAGQEAAGTAAHTAAEAAVMDAGCTQAAAGVAAETGPMTAPTEAADTGSGAEHPSPAAAAAAMGASSSRADARDRLHEVSREEKQDDQVADPGLPAAAAAATTTLTKLTTAFTQANALVAHIKQGADESTSNACREAMKHLRSAARQLALQQGPAVSSAVQQQRDAWLAVYEQQIQMFCDDLAEGNTDEGWKQEVLQLLDDV